MRDVVGGAPGGARSVPDRRRRRDRANGEWCPPAPGGGGRSSSRRSRWPASGRARRRDRGAARGLDGASTPRERPAFTSRDRGAGRDLPRRCPPWRRRCRARRAAGPDATPRRDRHSGAARHRRAARGSGRRGARRADRQATPHRDLGGAPMASSISERRADRRRRRARLASRWRLARCRPRRRPQPRADARPREGRGRAPSWSRASTPSNAASTDRAALAAFQEAYALVPSPKIDYDFGLAYLGLGRDARRPVRVRAVPRRGARRAGGQAGASRKAAAALRARSAPRCARRARAPRSPSKAARPGRPAVTGGLPGSVTARAHRPAFRWRAGAVQRVEVRVGASWKSRARERGPPARVRGGAGGPRVSRRRIGRTAPLVPRPVTGQHDPTSAGRHAPDCGALAGRRRPRADRRRRDVRRSRQARERQLEQRLRHCAPRQSRRRSTRTRKRAARTYETPCR